MSDNSHDWFAVSSTAQDNSPLQDQYTYKLQLIVCAFQTEVT